MFISRAELLPEDETIAEHSEAKRQETEAVEKDKANNSASDGGLFRGAFKSNPTVLNGLNSAGPIRDAEDGVDRCPRCAWELEDGICIHCGYRAEFSGTDFSNSGMSDMDEDDMEDLDEDIDIEDYHEAMGFADHFHDHPTHFDHPRVPSPRFFHHHRPGHLGRHLLHSPNGINARGSASVDTDDESAMRSSITRDSTTVTDLETDDHDTAIPDDFDEDDADGEMTSFIDDDNDDEDGTVNTGRSLSPTQRSISAIIGEEQINTSSSDEEYEDDIDEPPRAGGPGAARRRQMRHVRSLRSGERQSHPQIESESDDTRSDRAEDGSTPHRTPEENGSGAGTSVRTAISLDDDSSDGPSRPTRSRRNERARRAHNSRVSTF